jgi:competence protein ComGC
MRQMVIVTLLLVLFVPNVALSENGHPEPDLAEQIQRIQQQMLEMQTRHKQEMDALRALVRDLAEQETQKAAAPDESLDGRVAVLEEEIEVIQEEQVSLVEEVESKIDIDLYATLEFENFENSDSGFDARNIELLLNARMTDRLRAGAEIEFEGTAQTSGSSDRTGEVEVEQGWLEYYIAEMFKPRFGVVLVPFGKYNLEHFDPQRDLTDRPIVMRAIVPTTWAEAGAGFTGQMVVDMGSDHESRIDYAAYLVNGLTDHFTTTGMRDSRGSYRKDNNNNKALVGRAGIFPVDNLEIGFSGYFGNYDDDDDHRILGIDVDFNYAWRDFEFLGEYARFNLDESSDNTAETAMPDTYYGYYVQANYHFWPISLEDTFLSWGFMNPQLTASLRYGMAHIDVDGGKNNEEERWTVGMNYRPVEAYVFKFEYQFNSTENERIERGDNDGFLFSVTGAF